MSLAGSSPSGLPRGASPSLVKPELFFQTTTYSPSRLPSASSPSHRSWLAVATLSLAIENSGKRLNCGGTNFSHPPPPHNHASILAPSQIVTVPWPFPGSAHLPP